MNLGTLIARYKRQLGYILFVAILTAVFLYWRFPSEAVCEYLEQAASGFAPHVALRVHRARPALPLGLKLINAELGLKERPGVSLFKADGFVVTLSLRTLVVRRPVFRFGSKAYGGKIKGVIAFKKYSLGRPFDTDLQITGVRLDQYPFLKELLKRELTGEINGTVNYACGEGNVLHSSGSGDLSVSNGSLRLAQPFLGIEAIDLGRLDAQVVFEKQKISLNRLDFKGTQMEGKASGTIHVNPNLAKSTLDLTIEAKPFPSLIKEMGGDFDITKLFGRRSKDGSFTMTIRGTIGQPQISFG